MHCLGSLFLPILAVSFTSTFDIVAGNVSALLSTVNLLDRTEFFVCSSKVDGMNGRYYLTDEFQADEDTPVYIHDDMDKNSVTEEQDFRLFRHHGFWMFADMGQWPPKTHFRCDPTKQGIPNVNTWASCGFNLSTPPKFGYSPANSENEVQHLVLQQHSCVYSDHNDEL